MPHSQTFSDYLKGQACAILLSLSLSLYIEYSGSIEAISAKEKHTVLDKFHDECGLMGVWQHTEAANLTYLGLYAQQHRGQEGAGVVSVNSAGDKRPHFHVHKGLGLVADVFNSFDFSRLPGNVAIGHVRYTTAGGNKLANVQPFVADISLGCVAVAHNGNLTNTEQLRKELIEAGAIFGSTSDTEIVLHLLAHSDKDASRIENVISALTRLQGAFSLLILFEDRLIATRDRFGLRPLAIGKLDGATVLASETCAFDLIGASYERDVEPGEIVEIMQDGSMQSYYPYGFSKASPCIFEYVYFARPDSSVFGRNVYQLRKRMGAELSRENPVEADVVIAVPDSGVAAAIGYAEAAGIPYEMGLVRNHYVGRTFIEPKQSIRDFGVKIKLNPNADVLKGRSVVVVDDSIVRGTTSRKLVAMLRMAGANEVHLRISSPPTTDPCYYGIDTPDKHELIAARSSVQEIAEFIGVDSLAYLSLDGLYRAVGAANGSFCDACFTGKYPAGKPVEISNPRQRMLFDVD
jgi:amidophosphoribosyltransferase